MAQFAHDLLVLNTVITATAQDEMSGKKERRHFQPNLHGFCSVGPSLQ